MESAESATREEVIRNAHEETLVNYWDSKKDDNVNLLLGKSDGIYHHHYGIGDYDHSILDLPAEDREARIAEEMHRLENAQTELILEALGEVAPDDRVLDLGSGRGGTSFMIHDRFGCSVDGVNISQYQIDFSRRLAEQRGSAEKVKFHYRNMLATGFSDHSFQRLVSNETTPNLLDLFEAFGEFSRLLAPGGRYVVFTWCYNDMTNPPRTEIEEIDRHYPGNHIHSRSTYFNALAANSLVPCKVVDLTTEGIPYWDLRSRSNLRTGVEEAFLTAYRKNRLNFMLLAADRARG